jgi:hypothetical protein
MTTDSDHDLTPHFRAWCGPQAAVVWPWDKAEETDVTGGIESSAAIADNTEKEDAETGVKAAGSSDVEAPIGDASAISETSAIISAPSAVRNGWYLNWRGRSSGLEVEEPVLGGSLDIKAEGEEDEALAQFGPGLKDEEDAEAGPVGAEGPAKADADAEAGEKAEEEVLPAGAKEEEGAAVGAENLVG